jgi:5-formyltetrahydrofolate cyclo-ligase
VSKSALRQVLWQRLRDEGVARFPGARGRIPNFVGAEEAAERLMRTAEWRDAKVVKINPDSPQRPLRRAALDAGKTLYMPVPRLADDRPFFRLSAGELGGASSWEASSIKGASRVGIPVGLDEMAPIDLIVTGCVGVTRRGGRLGKGGGYSDLEYALLREVGLVTENTPIATTVHSCQIAGVRDLPIACHDISLDLVATESRLIRCKDRPERPAGILWEALDPDKIAAIPCLEKRDPGT